jgi:hypothetical protein
MVSAASPSRLMISELDAANLLIERHGRQRLVEAIATDRT